MKKFLKEVIIFILRLESRAVLFIKKPKIIAITGTVGKTTTKDILYAGLKNSFRVRKSPKGFNSDIGVLLAILNLETNSFSVKAWLINIIKGFFVIFSKNYPELLILEVGANYPKEIENSARLLKADIVIFTRLPKIMAHMEFFKDRQDFINEKLSLARYSNKDSVIFYNGDDKSLVKEMSNEIFKENKKISFGKKSEYSFNEVSIKYIKNKLEGVQVKFRDIEVNLKGVLGEHLGYPVSTLLAITENLKLNKEKIIKSFENNFEPAPGRMRIFQGLNNTTIIDDSYNALPESVKNGVEIFDKLKTDGRKIYVLGRLAELGDYTEIAYQKAIEYIRKSCDIIISVNDGGLAEKYINNLNFKEAYYFNQDENNFFNNTNESGMFLKKYLKKGDLVIFKGARHSTGFEKAISKLIKPEDVKYLVQDHLED